MFLRCAAPLLAGVSSNPESVRGLEARDGLEVGAEEVGEGLVEGGGVVGLEFDGGPGVGGALELDGGGAVSG